MRVKIFGGAVVAALVSAGAACAHHSGAMYDAQTKTTLQGTIEGFQWANPHAWVQLDVTDPATKKTTKWVFEGLGTNQLTRAGWHRDTLKPGDAATITFNPLKDGQPGGRFISAIVNGATISAKGGD